MTRLTNLDRQLHEVLIASSMASPSAINIDNEGQDLLDTLHGSLSSHVKIRRTQAKLLARKLYGIYHPDRTLEKGPLPGISFSQIRQLASQGELELLWYLRAQHGLETLSPEVLENAKKLLQIRIQHLEASPAYRVGRLFFSDRSAFLSRLSQLLNNQIVVMEGRIAALYNSTQRETHDSNQ